MEPKRPYISYFSDLLDAAFPKRHSIMFDLEACFLDKGFKHVSRWYVDPDSMQEPYISISKEIPEFDLTIHIEDRFNKDLVLTVIFNKAPESLRQSIMIYYKMPLEEIKISWHNDRRLAKLLIENMISSVTSSIADMMFNMIVTPGYTIKDLIDEHGGVKPRDIK